MTMRSMPVCSACWKKRNGDRVPCRLKHEALSEADRAENCHFCKGSLNDEPVGLIYVRMDVTEN